MAETWTREQYEAWIRSTARSLGEEWVLDQGLLVIVPCDPACGFDDCHGWRLESRVLAHLRGLLDD